MTVLSAEPDRCPTCEVGYATTSDDTEHLDEWPAGSCPISRTNTCWCLGMCWARIYRYRCPGR